MIPRVYEFKKGEARYILSHIQPKSSNEVVVILSAKYELNKNNEIIDSGDLSVDGLNLQYIFNAEEKGVYILSETVTIGAETFIEKARIIVS